MSAPKRSAALSQVAVGEAVVLLTPPLDPYGNAYCSERRVQSNDSLAAGAFPGPNHWTEPYNHNKTEEEYHEASPVGPGGCAASRSDSNRDMPTHPGPCRAICTRSSSRVACES